MELVPGRYNIRSTVILLDNLKMLTRLVQQFDTLELDQQPS